MSIIEYMKLLKSDGKVAKKVTRKANLSIALGPDSMLQAQLSGAFVDKDIKIYTIQHNVLYMTRDYDILVIEFAFRKLTGEI